MASVRQPLIREKDESPSTATRKAMPAALIALVFMIASAPTGSALPDVPILNEVEECTQSEDLVQDRTQQDCVVGVALGHAPRPVFTPDSDSKCEDGSTILEPGVCAAIQGDGGEGGDKVWLEGSDCPGMAPGWRCLWLEGSISGSMQGRDLTGSLTGEVSGDFATLTARCDFTAGHCSAPFTTSNGIPVHFHGHETCPDDGPVHHDGTATATLNGEDGSPHAEAIAKMDVVLEWAGCPNEQ